MDFKIDENLPIDVARFLTQAGHNASTVVEQGMGGGKDQTIAEQCKQESRALITLDVGFADIRTYPPAEHPGIIVLRLERQDKVRIVNVIERLMRMIASDEVTQRLWIVDEERVRIRG